MFKRISFLVFIVFALVAVASAADSSLVGWWKMDADSSAGNVVADSSGNGYNGTKGSDITWDNGSLKFTADYSSGIQFASTAVAGLFDSIDETITVSFSMKTAHGDSRQDIYTGSSTTTGARCTLEMFSEGKHLWAHLGAHSDKLIRWNVNNTESSNHLSLPKRWSMITLTKDINGGELIDPNDPGLGMTGIIKLYVDGVLLQSDTRLASWDDGGHAVNNSLAGIDAFKISGSDWSWYKGNLKDFRLYDRVLSDAEIYDLTGGAFEKAHIPGPTDGEGVMAEGAVEVELSWASGYFAASHDVYFGTDQATIATATTASPEFMGNQLANSFTTAPLTAGKYYWRIDEVNDIDVWTGDVWSFNVVSPVLWLKMDGPDPSNARLVKDYSGFGNDGSMGSSDVWTEIPGLGGAIDFAGGNWGATQVGFVNDGNDLIADMGLTDKATISLVISGHTPGDAGYAFTGLNSAGANIMSMEAPTGDTNHFLTKMGSGASNWCWSAFNSESTSYIFNASDARRLTITVDFTAGRVVYYLDANVWASFGVTGSFADLKSFIIAKNDYHAYDMMMSDFRIYNAILGQSDVAKIVGDYPKMPKKPVPAHESIDNALNSTLNWMAGIGAVSHDVYFGENYAAVKNADTLSSCYMGQQTTTTFDPGPLELM
ncbi:MAG TPA: hypothetical protein PLP05_08385, partial [Sedimentisphaerales bacterium]|nr:hypothetical protein [Sedimentisphaerales bacterium]